MVRDLAKPSSDEPADATTRVTLGLPTDR